jgi:hypothetical protein
MDRAELQLAHELGLHAGEEACDAIFRIANTAADDRSKTVAAITGMAYVVMKLNIMKKEEPLLGNIADTLANSFTRAVDEAGIYDRFIRREGE